MNVTIEQIRTALQALLVTKSAIATDIRELNYQGQTFVYPCIRYELICDPDHCGDYSVNFTVYCWSEQPSSLQVTQIRDEVAQAIHDNRVNTPIKLQNIKLLSAPTVVRDDRLWRGEAFFHMLATA